MLSKTDTRKTTLAILIDAFAKTYFSKKHTPFLYDMSTGGILSHIEPLFAFKGIETTVFTGLYPDVHNVWTEWCLKGNKKNSKNNIVFSKTIEAIDALPFDEAKVKFRYAFEKFLFNKSHTTPNLIPPAATRYFQPSQDGRITEPGVLGGIRTIFDIFREKGLRHIFIEPWIWGDADVCRKTKKLIKKEHHFDFWYLKFNHLDHLGHKFGPSPFIFREQLKKIDNYVEEIVTLLQRKNPDLNILILADHGMSRVRKGINIIGGLNELKSTMYKDYVAFADSTMIRFWFFTKDAQKEIHKYLQQINYGHILSLSEKKNLNISLDVKYGQTIYVLDEGYIVHPCFFHSHSFVNGMHGYAYPETPEAYPIIIMNKAITENSQINEKHLTYADIANIILNSILSNN